MVVVLVVLGSIPATSNRYAVTILAIFCGKILEIVLKNNNETMIKLMRNLMALLHFVAFGGYAFSSL